MLLHLLGVSFHHLLILSVQNLLAVTDKLRYKALYEMFLNLLTWEH